jgi:tetratricopeptide (TPR) repeat protein
MCLIGQFQKHQRSCAGLVAPLPQRALTTLHRSHALLSTTRDRRLTLRVDKTNVRTRAATKEFGLFTFAFLALLASVFLSQSSNASGQDRYSPQQAHAYITANDGNGAVRYASAWTKAEPNNSDAWAALGTAYGAGLHQPANAISAFQHFLQLKPDYPPCLNAMGVEYANLNRFPEAAAAFKRAAEKAQIRPNYWNNLAAAHAAMNKHDLALEALNNNARLAASHGFWTDWYNLGNGYQKQMDYQKAVAAYKRALQLNAGNGELWTNLGASEQCLGQWDLALQYYKKGMELGDKLGNQNYVALQNAIADAERRAKQASASGGNSIGIYNAVRDKNMRKWDSDHPTSNHTSNPYAY